MEQVFIDKQQEIIAAFLTEARDFLVSDLAANNRNATGRTSASIQVKNITPVSGQLVGNENVFATFTGRKPGGFPPLSKIVEWCVARGIPQDRAYVIAKNIAEFGTRLYRQGGYENNAIFEVTSEEYRKKLIEALTENIIVATTTDIDNYLNRP